MPNHIIRKDIISHPLEAAFGIEPNTTEIERTVVVPTDLVVDEDYDTKDREIESHLQNIIDAAMLNFESMSDIAQGGEKAYAARGFEVAGQFLSTALAAVKEKATQKDKLTKNKIAKEKSSDGVTNNNLFVDRNDLLEMLQSKN